MRIIGEETKRLWAYISIAAFQVVLASIVVEPLLSHQFSSRFFLGLFMIFVLLAVANWNTISIDRRKQDGI